MWTSGNRRNGSREKPTLIASVTSSQAGRLSRSVGAIAGIAEPGQNIGVLVEPFVDARSPKRGLRMQALESLDAFGRREQAHHPNILRAALLQAINRSD